MKEKPHSQVIFLTEIESVFEKGYGMEIEAVLRIRYELWKNRIFEQKHSKRFINIEKE